MSDDIRAQIMEQTQRCIVDITNRWSFYWKTLKFLPEVPLSEIIYSFSMPIAEFIKLNYPLLAQGPADLFWNMIFVAIASSKTHSIEVINNAVSELYNNHDMN